MKNNEIILIIPSYKINELKRKGLRGFDNIFYSLNIYLNNTTVTNIKYDFIFNINIPKSTDYSLVIEFNKQLNQFKSYFKVLEDTDNQSMPVHSFRDIERVINKFIIELEIERDKKDTIVYYIMPSQFVSLSRELELDYCDIIDKLIHGEQNDNIKPIHIGETNFHLINGGVNDTDNGYIFALIHTVADMYKFTFIKWTDIVNYNRYLDKNLKANCTFNNIVWQVNNYIADVRGNNIHQDIYNKLNSTDTVVDSTSNPVEEESDEDLAIKKELKDMGFNVKTIDVVGKLESQFKDNLEADYIHYLKLIIQYKKELKALKSNINVAYSKVNSIKRAIESCNYNIDTILDICVENNITLNLIIE